MNKRSKELFLYSLLIVPIMILLFSLFSNYYGKTIGYFVPYGIYLIILIIGIILFCPRKEKEQYFQTNHKLFYYVLTMIPVFATFFVAFLPTIEHFTNKLFFITLIYALLNGFLEEMFWRFTYNKMFGNNILLAFVIPTIIFSCWHFALLFAKGISYHGGAMALVGGACFMGILWGITMYKTKNVKIIILAHIVVNFFAFSQLIYQNWFALMI